MGTRKMSTSDRRGSCFSFLKCRRILFLLIVIGGVVIVASMFMEWDSLGLSTRHKLHEFHGQAPSFSQISPQKQTKEAIKLIEHTHVKENADADVDLEQQKIMNQKKEPKGEIYMDLEAQKAKNQEEPGKKGENQDGVDLEEAKDQKMKHVHPEERGNQTQDQKNQKKLKKEKKAKKIVTKEPPGEHIDYPQPKQENTDNIDLKLKQLEADKLEQDKKKADKWLDTMGVVDIKTKIKKFKEAGSEEKETKVKKSPKEPTFLKLDEELPELKAKPAPFPTTVVHALSDINSVEKSDNNTAAVEPKPTGTPTPKMAPTRPQRIRWNQGEPLKIKGITEQPRPTQAPETDQLEAVQENPENRTYPPFVTKAHTEKYACTVPQLDPWDKSFRNFLDRYPTKVCRKVQPNLVYIDQDNYLRFNQSELSSVNLTVADVECAYNTIERGKEDEDFQADLGPTRALTSKPQKLDKDVAQVSCLRKEDRSILYSEVLSYPVLDTSKKFANNSEDRLNVILIFVDSLSLSAMRRHMPKAYQFMEKEMGFKAMEGYTKVADNSFPNLIPILTGKRVHDQQPDMTDEFHEDISIINFDHWPLIWKEFAAKGYITAFSEDYPDMGLFHLKGHGFKQKPVDHFYINFWKALEWMSYGKKPTKDCYGNKTPAQILLELIRNHLIKHKDFAQFLYMYLTFPAHDDSAHMEYLDQYYYDFFQDVHRHHLFNRSFVMFLSDHGQRNSIIRTTTIGLLEERLPACLLYFPPWFYEIHPRIKENMLTNQDRLASNFDVYETLVDILKQNFGPQSSQRPAGSRGLSLLHPIPTNRTCKSAGIPFYFCTCQQMKWGSIPIHSPMAKYAAADFVYSLNEIIQKNSLCSRWTLRKLINAEIMDITDEEAGVTRSPSVIAEGVYKTSMQLVRVTVEAEVSFVNGTFQALMLFNQQENQLSLHSDIGRLDRYGNQSSCIGNDAHSRMKKLCVCRSYILNGTMAG